MRFALIYYRPKRHEGRILFVPPVLSLLLPINVCPVPLKALCDYGVVYNLPDYILYIL